MTPASQKYVPEIDGLRALAVAAVVLFHLQVSGVPGGFVGVDVFFVISGYLITHGLLQELKSSGRVDLGRFYMRRARRLLPALYAVLLGSVVVAVASLSHHRLPEFGRSLIAATLSLSNVHFYLGSGYFDTASDYKPLLHTWSLGVEEQFYLLWPLLTWLAWRMRQQTLPMAAMFLAASLLLSQWLLSVDAAAAFFLAPLRMHEFIVGAAIAIRGGPRRQGHGLVNDAGLALGLGLILVAMWGFDAMTPFPGLASLLPCMGTVWVLWAAPASRWRGVLNNRVMRYLGQTSYSTYLVHWSLIVFYRLIKGREHLLVREQVLLLLATLLMGHVLHRFVENRYRGRPADTDRRFLSGLVSLTLLLMAAGVAMQWDKWVSARSWAVSHISASEVSARRNERFQLRLSRCGRVANSADCDDARPGLINGLVIGDSHAMDAYNALVTARPHDHIGLSHLGGCPPHRAIETIVASGHPDLQACKALNLRRHGAAYLKAFDYLVLNVMLDRYQSEYLVDYLRFLHAQGVRKVVVFGQTWRAIPDLPELVNRMGFDHDRLMASLTPPPSDAGVAQEAARLGYFYVDKGVPLSRNGSFDVFDERGVLFTYDRDHLSLQHARRLLAVRKQALDAYLAP